MILYQDCSSHLDSSKNMATRRWGLFSLYNLYRKLSKSSCQKPLTRFLYNFAEMFLWWSFTKIVQAIWIRQKTWPPGGVAYFPYIQAFKWALLFLLFLLFPTFFCIPTFPYFFLKMPYYPYFLVQKCLMWPRIVIFFLVHSKFVKIGST